MIEKADHAIMKTNEKVLSSRGGERVQEGSGEEDRTGPRVAISHLRDILLRRTLFPYVCFQGHHLAI